MPIATSWGETQRRWGAILAELPPAGRDRFIRDTIAVEDAFTTYSLLLLLKYRWDCPDLTFDLLDEIFALQARRAPEADFEVWGQRARAALRRLVGVDPGAPRLLPN